MRAHFIGRHHRWEDTAQRHRVRGRRLAVQLSLAALLLPAGVVLAGGCVSGSPRRTAVSVGHAPSSAGRTAGATNWTVYHGNEGGSGQGPASLDLRHLRKKWTSGVLDGELYGEPLVWGATVYVATENDTVYALSASTGRVKWSHHLASPVPSGWLPCGDIAPTVGITSTPVIDTARGEIFVVADEAVSGHARHELYGLGAGTGRIELRQHVDPPGADPRAILQRASLTLDGDEVVFGFGGNYGDCSSYHGWVEAVPVTGGRARFFEVDRAPGDSQGAIWMGGAAPVVTAKGDIWVAAGNGSVHSPGRYDDSDSVLELSASLKLLQFFAPSSWYSDNASDLDLGSSVPAVLPNGLVVQAGKSQTAYLLKASHLGGIGHELQQIKGICGNDVDGGVAYTSNTAFLPCENGVMAVGTSSRTRRMHVAWQTPTGAGGPPILAGGYLWTISKGNGTLYALNPRNGGEVQQIPIGAIATSFPTPSVGDGMLLAPTTYQVHAFVGG